MNDYVKLIDEKSKSLIDAININQQIARELNCESDIAETFKKINSKVNELSRNITNINGDLSNTYLRNFSQNLLDFYSILPWRQDNILIVKNLSDKEILKQKKMLDGISNSLLELYHKFEFNLDFFCKLGFLNHNCVIVGANGSGKTLLSGKLQQCLYHNGLVLPAQRILQIPQMDSIPNKIKAQKHFQKYQQMDKTNKDNALFAHMQKEFQIALENLIATHIHEIHQYTRKAHNQSINNQQIVPPEETILSKTIRIWNSLIVDRELKCLDGINIIPHFNNKAYLLSQLSEGEKVMLYFIVQVLQTPPQGFIVIDEPEMYLHKTVLKKLWDILEKQRNDCLFIYLTHDLDFASSRITAKKMWLKSFDYPDQWNIEDIPDNDIPEQLLLEILGSKKSILFCEGEKGSIDETIYSTLFPELTVIPVRGCLDVINYTKAFNKIPDLTINAIGLIDRDHSDLERLESLQKDKIYSIDVSEAENLLLDEEFLTLLGKQVFSDVEVIDKIKQDIIQKLHYTIEEHCSRYVIDKVHYYFRDSHISHSSKYNDLEINYKKFSEVVTLQEWFEQRKEELKNIIETNDYPKVISVIHNKGLGSIVQKHLGVSDFPKRSIEFFKQDREAQQTLLKYFPEELKKYNNSDKSNDGQLQLFIQQTSVDIQRCKVTNFVAHIQESPKRL